MKLVIQSQSHPYSVETADTLEAALARAASPAFHLVDRNLLKLYPQAYGALDPARVILIDATEEEKSYERIAPLFLALLKGGFRKDSSLIVSGGGVTQDIGCFIASTLFRGARWELIPTTLLAQCDSCIGSKSSINIGEFKNQIGTFYPPHVVHLVTAALRTLPRDEIRSGIGESLKLALIAGEPALSRIRAQVAAWLADEKDFAALEAATLETLAIKKPFIEEDERDRGRRNLLNYGHTFGHAYESATAFAIPHGIAVSLGMLTATWFSERLSLAPAGHAAEVRAWLEPFVTPYDRVLARADRARILAGMKQDKKNTSGKINLILTRGPGKMEKTPITAEQVEPLLAEFLAQL